MDTVGLANLRLRSHLLSAPVSLKPAAVVAHFGAMQAQEYAAAKWSIGQRATGLDDAAVQRAVDDGLVLRTHALRPTWHFVAASDIEWIQALTSPRVHQLNAHYYRLHAMDHDTAAKTSAVITSALRGGNHLTRSELAGALALAGLPATGNHLAYVVIWAELEGLIANGPMRGKQHTYALVTERVPAPVALTGDDALAELTRRYFTSHGPATIKDFAWWSSLTQVQIRRGLDLLGPELDSLEVGARGYRFAPGSAPSRPKPPSVHLLQAYDEYTIGYTESRDVANIAGARSELQTLNAAVHAVIVDTQLAAAWRRRADARGITVELGPVRMLSADERHAINAAFARYAAFSGTPVVVDW